MISKGLTQFFTALFILLFANSVSFFAQAEDSGASIYELQPGTKIKVRLANEINSEAFGADDTFIVRVEEPLEIRKVVVLPAETVIEGRIREVQAASFGGKNGKLEIVFETLRLADGSKIAFEAVPVEIFEAKSAQTANILTVIGGTALGALIGTATGSENGALIGAALGAGAGTGTWLIRKGKNIRIKTGEVFDIKLTKKVTLPPRDF